MKQKKVRRFVNIKNSRPGAYERILKRIARDKVCPFCPENLKKYHTPPILRRGKYWVLTPNMYPYPGARVHLILIVRDHVEKVEDLPEKSWAELRRMTMWAIKKYRVAGGSLLLRFGDNAFNGSSVHHLHAQFIVGDIMRKGYKPVLTRVG